MRKLLIIFSFILAVVTLEADDKVEIYASKLTSHNDTIDAGGGVSVIYKDYLLTAQRAHYDKKTGILELFDNIRANYQGKYKILGKYAKLNIAKKERFFKPFYMLEKESDVWMSADEGLATEDEIDISSGVVSGCDPIDPLWTMEFSSSDYDTDSMWLNLYNTRLYIYDIPVLYTPYFGYSLDTTRRTGLLKPSVGYSSDEGFYYQQPIYIAEQNWWDLEFLPQIRTQRGSGLYTKFRFVDSAVSRGFLELGYFKEKEEYYLKNNLQNQSHYGYKFFYDNPDFLNQWTGLDFDGQSGIYIDINHMNDVDYINLKSSGTNDNLVTATQVLSRANIFYNTDNHYVGAYFKYYQDLTLDNNENTLQKLPTLHYHYYLNTFLKEHMLYSLDVQSNNIWRQRNKKVTQTNFNLPLTLQTPLFDEYLNLSYTANIYGQLSQFSGETKETTAAFRNGYYARNSHRFVASSQLTRAYDEFSHVMSFSLSYTHSAGERKTGYYLDNSEYCKDELNIHDPEYEAKCEFYNIADVDNATKLEFIQYLYNDKSEEFLYHRMAQRISYEGNHANRYGELENELDVRFFNNTLSYYNNMFYNHDKHSFSKILNKISYHDYGVGLSVSHLYRDTFKDPTTQTAPSRYTRYLTSNASYEYNRHYSFDATYNYDLQKSVKKGASIGFMYKKRCWDFGIKYAENRRPILTQGSEASYIYDRYIYITVVLKPLMQATGNSSFITYKLPSNEGN
ncbi:MAG: LPS assembly protein LptD [Sulfurimonas sp.]